MTASKKVHLPFERPFDKLTVLSKVEGLTALSRAEGLRCASSFFYNDVKGWDGAEGNRG